MSELSPAAKAVLDAFLNGYIAAPKSGVAFCDDRKALAAALRAAADQVVPKDANPHWDTSVDWAKWRARDDVRDELLDIATELEAQ